MSFNYGGTANNGNAAFQTVARGSVTQTQSYVYDGVNRLCAAAEATGTGTLAISCGGTAPSGANWSQNYNYDQFGNRWVSNPTGYSLGTFTPVASSNFNGGNHLNMGGVVHDAAGNQTQLGTALVMAYDADGRMESNTLGGLPTLYGYDADGRRVLKRTGAATVAPTVYVYDASGQLAMETGGASVAACTTCYLTVDPLGSTRETVAGSNAPVGCHDYLPFGEELNGIGGRTGSCWGAGETTLRFTGKERDAETTSSAMATGLDYFGARYMSSAQGRFTSPDPKMFPHDLTDPQSWNKYGYTRNNPLRYTDPDGEDWGEFFSGVADTTYRPFVQAASHPLNTLAGLGSAISHPINTAIAIKNGVVDTTQAALSGDSTALGQVTGTILSTVLTAGAAKAGSVLLEGAEAADVASTAAVNAADAAQAGGRTSGVAAGLRVGDQTFSDVSSGGMARVNQPGVQRALDNVPAAQRSAYHGACAEIGCLNQAAQAGVDPAGGTMSAVKIRRPGNPAHATPIAPCSTCKNVMNQLGVNQ